MQLIKENSPIIYADIGEIYTMLYLYRMYCFRKRLLLQTKMRNDKILVGKTCLNKITLTKCF